MPRPRIARLLCGIVTFALVAIAPAAASSGSTHPDVTARTLEQRLYNAPAFAEPLVPMGPTTRREDRALLAAVGRYDPDARPMDLSPLTRYLQAHPHSPWRVALLTNLGLADYGHGYFGRAIAAFRRAWRLGRTATGPRQRALVDDAVGQLVEMHARLGHAHALAALLHQVRHRPMDGPATEMIDSGKDGLWHMRHDPGVSYLCGPMALKSILLLTHRPDSKAVRTVEAFRSGPHGAAWPRSRSSPARPACPTAWPTVPLPKRSRCRRWCTGRCTTTPRWSGARGICITSRTRPSATTCG